ncbi:Hypothetical protein NCS54_00914700 [Fusarium falciforme]|uniref:Hypothetical protein n=1 Tax=Fusarium falciforme TaxID=195108 RepID=UPI002300FD54|nr:Hypothetical protein NCS54_00914700 [Fusarium falciforme]WAO91667.1 Hypothetical protein NCS54_00914700 [Fusarium falciforme]
MPLGAVLRASLTLGSTLTLLALFWAQLARSRQQSHNLATYTSSHVFFNTLSLVATVFVIGSHFWEALSASTSSQRLEGASCTAAWSAVLLARLTYFASPMYRRPLHVLANSLSFALFLVNTVPTIVYPLVIIPSAGRRPVLDTLLLCNLGSTLIASVILPVFTPAHSILPHEGSSLHPSLACSPIVRWWSYGWVTPFVASAYKKGGQLDADHLPELTVTANPLLLSTKFVEARRKSDSTRQTLWYTFKDRLLIMAMLMVFCGFSEFLGAIGLRSLLTSLEGNARDGSFRPWFSAFLFGASPVIRGLFMQTFEFFSTDTICRLKGMVICVIHKKILKQRGGGRIDVGQVTNHVAADIDKISILRYTIMAGFMVPVEVAVASIILYQTLGWSSLPGLALIVITRIPISWYVNRYQGRAQSRVMEAIEARVRRVSEVIDGLQTIKMLGQSLAFTLWISEKRKSELRAIWKKLVIATASETLSSAFVLIPLILSLCIHTLIAGHHLSPAVVFTVVSVFNTLKGMMSLAVIGVSTHAQAMVSVDRVVQFLDQDVDSLLEQDDTIFTTPYSDESRGEGANDLGARNASIAVRLPDNSHRKILRGLSFQVPRGGLTVITGKTGSGKSTLIKALLGDAPVISGEASLRSNGPETISYASQAPWLRNSTIRDNILFGGPFVSKRYHEVTRAVALHVDFRLLPNGDLTPTGEAGSSLSGGQRARVALARAIYANTDIVVLDDVLSALDATTSSHIIDECIFGPLMRGRTTILVSDKAEICRQADQVVELVDGEARVSVQQRDTTALKPGAVEISNVREVELFQEPDSETQVTRETRLSRPPTGEDSSRAQSEKVLDGLIGKSTIFKYLGMFGSPTLLAFLCVLILSGQAADTLSSLWLTKWSASYSFDQERKTDTTSLFFASVYSLMGLSQLALACVSTLLFYRGAIRASRKLHYRMLVSVFGATFPWITSTPAGQILNRFSSDVFSLDNTVNELLKQVVENSLSIGFRLAAVSSMLPLFLLPALIFLCMAWFTGRVYLYGSTAAKRLYAASLSPVLSELTDAVSGGEIIRAYNRETMFRQLFLESLEKYLRGWETVSGTQRWLAVRMDVFAGLIQVSTAILSITSPNANPAVVGFSMTSASALCTALLYLVYLSSVLEIEMNCFQRIEEYTHAIPQELKNEPEGDEGLKDLEWPTRGELEIVNLTAGYSPEKAVLADIDVQAQPGQRVAIVGRSGSGKSSLAATILGLTSRIDGRVLIDGMSIDSVGVEELRRGICFIPQNPMLFTGPLRFNLDFTGTVPDKKLRQILSDVMGDTDSVVKWSLDRQIERDGANLSQGERQLIAITRALATSARIVIIDEATASLDAESESRMQKLLAERFSDKVVMAIAHRLATIVDFDEVYVLDQGRIIERGVPRLLLESRQGQFWKLWQSMDQQQRRDA